MKNKLLVLLGVAGLALAGCSSGEETADPTEKTTAQTSDTSSIEETSNASESPASGETSESEYGTMTMTSDVIEINETQTSGDFDITILEANKYQLVPKPDYVDIFGGENLAGVSIEVEVTNNSDATNTIYPNQGTIVDNLGNQVDADLFISDDIGGDFYGQVTKTGVVTFLYDEDSTGVESVRYIIGSGHDEDWNNFGEDLEFTINF